MAILLLLLLLIIIIIIIIIIISVYDTNSEITVTWNCKYIVSVGFLKMILFKTTAVKTSNPIKKDNLPDSH
jgi:hypothetical protein